MNLLNAPDDLSFKKLQKTEKINTIVFLLMTQLIMQ